MLAEAKTASIQNGISNISFRTEDVHNLKFSDFQFDIVASRFAVHHFSDVRRALQEMCRVLKPCGKTTLFGIP
ncbi:class I SAM-dependent methyltransferase [Desulfosporosinus meridiei]|uniref:class I SAM-dependent methyltransferase n=1 Tax=Desulfosporosinus meridiei TaxID=79209 RepID=UPI00030ED6A9|nr:class I SAM-dependent methyltransferase [Desulfosporosinus meridiei]